MTDIIRETSAHLKEELKKNPYFKEHPEQLLYRIDHSMRVTRIGIHIAEEEGIPVEDTALACLLHDIAYGGEFRNKEERMNHGRTSADIATVYLREKGLPEDRISRIAFAISIHVDNRSHMEGTYDSFAYTVRDADNIDRFDVYRIYENLHLADFGSMELEKKIDHVTGILDDMERFRKVDFATPTADALWKERLSFQKDYFERLLEQLRNSRDIV